MSGLVFLILRFILTISLYTFLGWALICIWRDIKQQSMLLAARKIPSLKVSIKGKDKSSQIRRFNQAEIILGRDPNCDFPIEDEAVSARHARLSYHHGHWWLEDLDSTNGTLLNKERITVPTVVINKDMFICGHTQCMISLTNQALIPFTQKINKRRKSHA